MGQSEDQTDELDALARRYVDLWQDQMTALAADPAFAESMQKAMASMGVASSGLPAMWSAWPAAMASLMAAAGPGMSGPDVVKGQESDGKPGAEPAGGQHKGARQGPAAAPGPAAAAAASDGGGPDLGVLEARLAALEQRLLALEGGTGRTRSRAKGKTKRN